MLEKQSVDRTLRKAGFYVKKHEFQEAIKLYQSVLITFPKNLRAQQGLANLNKFHQNNTLKKNISELIDQLVNLYNQGKYLTVVEQAKAILEQYPNTYIVWNILGVSSEQLGMIDDAIKAYNKTISLNPNYAEAFNNKGNALKGKGELDNAIDAYKKATTLKPNYAEAYSNMGYALQDKGKLDEAIVAYKKALFHKNDSAEIYSNLGNALQDKGKLDEAIKVYKKALMLKPNFTDAYYNLGNAFKDQGNLDMALESYYKALSLNPNYVEVYNNLGVALKDQGKLDDAIDAHKKALLISPDNYIAHKNLSYVLLNRGKLKEGFDEYEWRWKDSNFLSQHRDFSKPKWDGQKSLSGKKILLWSEQGLGDTINWSSCVSLISSRAEHCILECQEKLVPLLKQSFTNIEVKAENSILDTKRDDFDFHLPMGSLYKQFIQEIFSTRKAKAFLIPDLNRVNYWKKRLNSLGKGPYIGVSWKSLNMSPPRLPNYAPITEWYPIFTIPDVTFINLQYKDFEDDLTKIKNELEVTVHNFDDLDHFNNLLDVAALSAALDIVVSIKNTVPMISAGTGTLTKLVNWRQSPWNNILLNPAGPLVDIFEKNTWEPWSNVFSLIAEDILKLKIETNNLKDIF